MPKKLVLIPVDSLRSDMLLKSCEAGSAPHFAELIERGTLITDCVSSFPSVTPVCTSEIMTGTRPDRHRIPGMNWYHRAERRYVEYGSSWEATRTFGLFTALYDTVYNMNMGHLSSEVTTLYEELADAGFRSAATPFLIYRGRTRHELGLDGLLRAAASAARFHHAVWGPDELFYGELYASRKVPCKPTLARPDVRDDYSACVGVELVEKDLYDFLLFSLPDNDHHSHKHGPEASEESIAHADQCFGQIVAAAGGMDEFLDRNAVILMADHSQSNVDRAVDLPALLSESWRVLRPNDADPGDADVAVGPSGRGGGIWILREGERGRHIHRWVRDQLGPNDDFDLVCWLCDEDGNPLIRSSVGPPPAAPEGAAGVVVERGGSSLTFRPDIGGTSDLRGSHWSWEGDAAVLDLDTTGGLAVSETYPDALSRLWAALHGPYSGDVMVSMAPGRELADWGRTSHVPGGSHGSLHADDSLAPLLWVGLDAEVPPRDQWAISDAADLVRAHFGLDPGAAR